MNLLRNMIFALSLISIPAFANCPAGMQGSSDFREAAATMMRDLGQRLTSGSGTLEQCKPENNPLKLVFHNRSGHLFIIVYRSNGGKNFYVFKSGIAEICSGGGKVEAVAQGTEIPIAKNGNGLVLSLPMLGDSKFANLMSPVDLASASAIAGGSR